MDRLTTILGDTIEVRRVSPTRFELSYFNGVVRRALILGVGDAHMLASMLLSALAASPGPKFRIVGGTDGTDTAEDHPVD
jgi:hypothetical protein